MNFKAATTQALVNFANFSGRASRSEFWYFMLAYFLGNILTSIIDVILAQAVGFGFLTPLYGLALFIPSMSCTVRRLHDKDKSGWWQLLNAVPFGCLVLLYWYVTPGSEGDNRFGPNPLGEASDYPMAEAFTQQPVGVGPASATTLFK
jgi:uncharacterized membrane protein YhaH (DUF805 family)